MCTRWTSAHEQSVFPDALSSSSASQGPAVTGVFANGAGVTWIAGREVCWTVALRLVPVDSTQSIQAATHPLARIANLTLAAARHTWVPVTAGVASALVAIRDLATLSIYSARFAEALVVSCEN